MDGFEASRKLTEMMDSALIPRIPIVACTANALDQDREKCKLNGMIKFLIKPI